LVVFSSSVVMIQSPSARPARTMGTNTLKYLTIIKSVIQPSWSVRIGVVNRQVELLGFETHVKPNVTSNVLDFSILLVDVMVTDLMCEMVA
jgi:hypothetical protein